MNTGEKQAFELCLLDKSHVDEIWDIFARDLSLVPRTWAKSRTDLETWLTNRQQDQVFPRRYAVRSIEASSNEIVGFVSADQINTKNIETYDLADAGDINVSYMTLPEHAGKGIATFSVDSVTKQICDLGFEPILRIASWNKQSISVALKCGYKKVDAQILVQETYDFEPTLLELYRRIP